MPPGRPRFRGFSPPSVRVFPFLRRLSFHGERRDMRIILSFRYRERQGNPQAWIPLSFCQLVIASLAPHTWSFQDPVQQPFCYLSVSVKGARLRPTFPRRSPIEGMFRTVFIRALFSFHFSLYRFGMGNQLTFRNKILKAVCGRFTKKLFVNSLTMYGLAGFSTLFEGNFGGHSPPPPGTFGRDGRAAGEAFGNEGYAGMEGAVFVLRRGKERLANGGGGGRISVVRES